MKSEWGRRWRGEEVRRVRVKGFSGGMVVRGFWQGGMKGGRVKAKIQGDCR